MGWKNIKETLHPDMNVYVDKKKKQIIITYFGNEVITISTINFNAEIVPEYKTSNIVMTLFKRLQKSGKELKYLFEEPDFFDNDIPVFLVRDNKIIVDFCEEYGYGKVTHSGEKMNGSYFDDRKDAKSFLRKTTSENLKAAFFYSFVPSLGKVVKSVWKLVKALYVLVKVRM